MVEPTPWPKMPPPGAPRAVDLIADVLHDAFKGDTDVDLDLLAADIVDTLQGKALTVELRWYDGDEITSDGVVVLGRTELETQSWHTGRSWAGHAKEDSCPCPKAPCGLADGYAPGCPEYDPAATKTIRQRHRAEDCPGAGGAWQPVERPDPQMAGEADK